MNNLVSKIIKTSLLSSIALAILGLLLIFLPDLTITTIAYVVGGVLIAIGVIAFINYLNKKEEKNEIDIIYGIGMVILGIIVITSPEAVASIIPFILGVVIVINSAAKLDYSFKLKQDHKELWLTTLIASIITLICGIFLIFNPFAAAEFITILVGIVLFVYAVIDIFANFKIRKVVKTFHKEIEDKKIKEADVIEDNTKTEE